MRSDFKIRLPSLQTFMPTGQEQPMTGLLFDVLLWNLGDPSAIVEWKLIVEVPNKAIVEAGPLELPEVLNGNTGMGVPTLRLIKNDLCKLYADIDRKVVAGNLQFFVKLRQPDVLNMQTKLTLVATDIFDNKTGFSKTIQEWTHL
jgi:hypothetical protein